MALARTLYVVALDPNRKFGSLEEQTLTLARAFRDRGSLFVPVFEVGPRGEVQSCFIPEGLPVEGLNLWHFSPGTLRHLVQTVDRHGVDLVHWNFYDPLNPYLFGLSALRPRIRHLFTNHSSRTWPLVTERPLLTRRVKTTLLGRYEWVLGVSDFVVRCMEQEGWWGRVGRFHHFVNLDRFRPDPVARERYRRDQSVQDAFVIVAVAQLIVEKGIQVLLESMRELPPDTRLWVIGEGPYRPTLEAQAREYGLDSRVVFFGAQSRIERLLQAADVASCPSVWAEAAGLVNLEAQAVGLPMVASDVGGIPEFVRHGETGLLFPPGDRAGVTHHLRVLHDDRELRTRMGRAARQLAERDFGPAASLERNLSYYRQVDETDSPRPLPGRRKSGLPGAGG